MNTRTKNSLYRMSQWIGLMALPGLIALSIAPVQAQHRSPKSPLAQCTTPTTSVRATQDDCIYVLRRGSVYQLRCADLSLVSRKTLPQTDAPLGACFVRQDGSPVETPLEDGAKLTPRDAKKTAASAHKVRFDTQIDAQKYGGSANSPADNPGTAENNYTGGMSMPLSGYGRMAGKVDGTIPVLTWTTTSPSRRSGEAAQSDTASYIYMLRGNRLYQYRAKDMSLTAQRDLALLDMDRALHGGSDYDARPSARGLVTR